MIPLWIVPIVWGAVVLLIRGVLDHGDQPTPKPDGEKY